MPIVLPFLLGAAAALPCPAGRWELKASGQGFFRLVIDRGPAGIAAIWERPQSFDIDGETNGEQFSHVQGPSISRSARQVHALGDDIDVTFDDPSPGATPDVFRLHCVGANQLVATYEGTPFEPFSFVRMGPGGPGLGPWQAGQAYVRAIDRRTNDEMTAIFNADQADRRAEKIDWSVVDPADHARRARTEDLLAAGALESGADFYHAAFVFQHGSGANDYLKAHLLAMVAIARGYGGAVWIASATLDRYLQSIGKAQVLGTQYLLPKKAPPTQEPFDRTVASDMVRKALHVPPLAEQEQERRRMAAEAAQTTRPDAAAGVTGSHPAARSKSP